MNSGFGIRGSGFRIPGSGFGLRGSGFRIPGSGFGLRRSGFGLRSSGFGHRSSGFGLRDSGFGVDGSNGSDGCISAATRKRRKTWSRARKTSAILFVPVVAPLALVVALIVSVSAVDDEAALAQAVSERDLHLHRFRVRH